MTAPAPGFDDLPAAAVPGTTADRGRLVGPDLDDRRWADIVAEVTALIDTYAPQWTDRNPSDIGMTLVELFGWLVESLVYRLNRVPEKHYVALLNLLGVRRAPMLPARTLLTFGAAGGPVTVPAGTAAQTAGSETDPPAVFETDTELLVVPPRPVGIGRVDNPSATPPVHAGPADAVGVRLARGAGTQLCLALDVDGGGAAPATFDVYVEPFRAPPAPPVTDPFQPPSAPPVVERVDWVFSAPAHPPTGDPLLAAPWQSVRWGPWQRLQVVSDATAGLTRPGLVRLRVPAGVDWVVQDPQDTDPARRWTVPGSASLPPGPHRWLGLRFTNDSPAPAAGAPAPGPLELRVDRLLPNTTTATSVRTVTNEALGTGTGAPGQTVPLAHRPVYAAPGDPVRVSVGGTAWREVDELPDAPGQVFLLDAGAGEVTFGDGGTSTGRGTPPAAGQPIVADRYRYVAAGAAGNLLPDTVRVLSSGGTAGPGPGRLTGVTNPVPATGGADEEPIETTKGRVPGVLRHRGRAVTVDDYETLALAAHPALALARCLPPVLGTGTEPGTKRGDPWTYGNLRRAPGVVNVLVVPDLGTDVTAPVPSLAMVQDVVRALDRVRPIATALHVDGPRYVKVGVRAEVTVFPQAKDQGLVSGEDEVYAGVRQAVTDYLHPVHGRGGTGWQLGQSVYLSDLYQAARPADDVGFVTDLVVIPEQLVYAPDDPEDQRPIPDTIGADSTLVRIADYELVCPGTITVSRTGTDTG